MYNNKQIKRLELFGYAASILVLSLVLFMRKIHITSGIDFHFLPPIYSCINFLAGITLIVAYVHIRNKRIDQHKKWMTLAMIMSCLFLLMYVIYHITTPDTKFCGEGFIRYVYFFFLISHVILAAISFPFIVFTYIKGLTDQIMKHRKLAKWVFPIWLYVCFTGPICYIFLYPCYPK